MFEKINEWIKWLDGAIWGLPLIIFILAAGIFMTIRLGGLQIRKLPKALKYMVKNEEGGHGEVSSFGALCTALSATIGTGNIVGVATAVVAGGPGALFWMWIAAFFGMATKFSEACLPSNTVISAKTDTYWADPFIILKKAWESDGSGLLSCSLSLACAWACSESAPLPRSTAFPPR